MSAFVITRMNTELLDSPVFATEGNHEAVALFSKQSLAEEYLQAARWDGEYCIAEIRMEDVAIWFQRAAEGGVEMAMVDPIRSDQLSGVPQDVVKISDPHGAVELLQESGMVMSDNA